MINFNFKKFNEDILNSYDIKNKETDLLIRKFVRGEYKDNILNSLNLDSKKIILRGSINRSGATLPVIPWYSLESERNQKFYTTILFDIYSKKTFLSIQMKTDNLLKDYKDALLFTAQKLIKSDSLSFNEIDFSAIRVHKSTHRPLQYKKYSIISKEITSLNNDAIISLILKYLETTNILNNKYSLADNDQEIREIYTNINAGTSFSVIKSRIGQERWKKELINMHGAECAICNVQIRKLLLASHIKPWSKSTNNEKGDIYNGLILCPNHDALFDKGYITFNDEGYIEISKNISLEDQKSLFISPQLILKSSYCNSLNKIREYMKFHNKKIFKH